MLVLTRKNRESIAINDDIKITILQIKGKQVRIGIDAPRQTKVHRYEVYQAIQEENQKALNAYYYKDIEALLMKGNAE